MGYTAYSLFGLMDPIILPSIYRPRFFFGSYHCPPNISSPLALLVIATFEELLSLRFRCKSFVSRCMIHFRYAKLLLSCKLTNKYMCANLHTFPGSIYSSVRLLAIASNLL